MKGTEKKLITDDPISGYKKYTGKKTAATAMLFAVVIVLAAVCINAGASSISPSEVIKALFGYGESVTVVRSIRLPRVLAAIIAGIGLGSAGCVMQGVLRNPMASPSTLGVSNAAVFGANVAIVFLGAGRFNSTHGETVSISSPYTVTLCAFVCALAAVALILVLSHRRGFSPEAVVLSGVAMGAVFSAGTTIVQFFAMDTQVAAAVFWTFGDLGRASMEENGIMAAAVGISLVYYMINAWNYNAMTMGDETAASLGVRIGTVRFISLLSASVICAVCVSFLGIIGFVGLAAPQVMKRFVGNDYRFLVPCSALLGAALMLFADTVARSVLKGIPLPVGAVTSLLGGPIFLWMLLKKKGGRI